MAQRKQEAGAKTPAKASSRHRRVRFLNFTGSGDLHRSFDKGEVAEVPTAYADDLIKRGLAEPAKG